MGGLFSSSTTEPIQTGLPFEQQAAVLVLVYIACISCSLLLVARVLFGFTFHCRRCKRCKRLNSLLDALKEDDDDQEMADLREKARREKVQEEKLIDV